jgi:hypothetical protein
MNRATTENLRLALAELRALRADLEEAGVFRPRDQWRDLRLVERDPEEDEDA